MCSFVLRDHHERENVMKNITKINKNENLKIKRWDKK